VFYFPERYRIARLKSLKKAKEREKKGAEANSRKQLANMRVVRKNLVYVTGLSSKVASEEVGMIALSTFFTYSFNKCA
jgi:hypothetical protein